MGKFRLYSVGHSSQSQEEFLELLKRHDVNCIVDVRSLPASKYTPQFNEDALKSCLCRHGVLYVPFGKHFGARRSDCLKETEFIKKGVKEMKPQVNLQKGFCISLMCSEANPLECHRFSLVSRYFYDNGLDVQHILKDGELASHESLEKEMIDEYLHSRKPKLADIDQLFGSYTAEDQRRDAYRLKNKEIGYKPQYELEETY